MQSKFLFPFKNTCILSEHAHNLSICYAGRGLWWCAVTAVNVSRRAKGSSSICTTSLEVCNAIKSAAQFVGVIIIQRANRVGSSLLILAPRVLLAFSLTLSRNCVFGARRRRRRPGSFIFFSHTRLILFFPWHCVRLRRRPLLNCRSSERRLIFVTWRFLSLVRACNYARKIICALETKRPRK